MMCFVYRARTSVNVACLLVGGWVGGCKEGKRCLSAVCCIFRCRAAIVELQEAFFFSSSCVQSNSKAAIGVIGGEADSIAS